MQMVRAGGCFYLSTPRVKLGHLWLILTDPEGDPPRVVAVMLRTKKAYTDDTLILVPGDHPFLDRESCVQYSSVEFMRVDEIVKWSGRPGCGIHPDMSADLLARVRAGLLKSPYAVLRIQEYCRERFG